MKLNIATTRYSEYEAKLIKQILADYNPTLSLIKDITYIDDNFKGIVFFGGGSDVYPKLYSEYIHPSSSYDVERDIFEQAIFMKYENNPNVKFAGICRGCQFLNVMCHGTLYQDLPSVGKAHSFYHKVVIDRENTMLGKYVPDIFTVNSTHHQAVQYVGRGLIGTLVGLTKGVTDDVIEGIESIDDDKIRAVQSHPESGDYFYYNNYSQVIKYLFRIE